MERIECSWPSFFDHDRLTRTTRVQETNPFTLLKWKLHPAFGNQRSNVVWSSTSQRSKIIERPGDCRCPLVARPMPMWCSLIL